MPFLSIYFSFSSFQCKAGATAFFLNLKTLYLLEIEKQRVGTRQKKERQ